MPIFKVNVEKCRHDGICSKVCPVMIINNDENGVPFLIPGGAERCIGCGQCVAFCPHEAASLEGLPMERATKINRELIAAPEALAELMKSRRSVRVFASKPVPCDVLEQIIDMASYAPTAKNQRKVRWVMVQEAAKIEQIINLVADFLDQSAGANPSTAMERSAKMLANAARKGKDPILRGGKQLAVAVAQNDYWGTSDAAIALSYFELAAHSLGVGCCWAGYFTNACAHSAELRALLGIKDGEAVRGGQILGYPAIKATYVPPRKAAQVEWI